MPPIVVEPPRKPTQPAPVKVEAWRAEGFDVLESLGRVRGRFFEVAGPTKEYKLVDLEKLRRQTGRQLHVSNLGFGGAPKFDAKTGELIAVNPAHLTADGTALPLAEGSVGALFCSCLSTVRDRSRPFQEQVEMTLELRKSAVSEAARVLEHGGLLVWQGGGRDMLDYAKTQGFNPKQYAEEYACIVFEKG